MKLYGVDLRSLSSVDERTALYEELHAYGETSIDVFGKSGVVEAVIVGWADNAPFPGVIKILPNYPQYEILPGYLEAYQENFR